mmetsp:Transcript_28679/g.48164  ORF Transcript_28679/g.48164 Transcript_28679/m.48164 type:complete len:307 (-) Transcript_28679:1086-2006(-)
MLLNHTKRAIPICWRRMSLKLRNDMFSVQSSTNLFDRDTNVIEEDTGKYSSLVTNNWSIGDAPNGGYLMAIAISAARKVVNFRDPLTVSAYYCNKALENTPVDIQVQSLNRSKGSETALVSFSQEGILRSQYIGTFGSLAAMSGLNHMQLSAPVLPPPADCTDCSKIMKNALGNELNIVHNIQYNAPETDPLVKGLFRGEKVEVASFSCWAKFTDNRAPCLRSLSFFCDAMPPPVLAIHRSNWVPTLEYTVHFWQRPSDTDQWLRARFSTPVVVNSMLYTDGEMWSEDGKQLLATSRQLARVLTPR